MLTLCKKIRGFFLQKQPPDDARAGRYGLRVISRRMKRCGVSGVICTLSRKVTVWVPSALLIGEPTYMGVPFQ